jgi:pimeloyl-ACP methyl ester carboxylesterase
MNSRPIGNRILLILASVAFLPSFLACAGQSTVLATASTGARAFDPATSDRPFFDLNHPPVIAEMGFQVEGATLNAIIYEAQGAGPHPTVVLLHGFPGNERNLDLAQAIRRAGWNVVFFHYRGAWGSGGLFSFTHVLEDVAAVVAAISDPEFASRHRIDADRIALVGHSMGGFAALISGAKIERVDCVVSIAGANLGGLARLLQKDPEAAAGFAALIDGWSGPVDGPPGATLIAEMTGQADRFDTAAHAGELAQKDLLLLAGRRDVVTPPTLHHAPLVEALKTAGAESFEAVVFEEADHAFSGQRIALARRVTSWLGTGCAPAN